MVHCLYICEILQNVLRFTEEGEALPTSTHHKTVHSVALTCKAFSETALDELWKRIYGLEPLLRLFPDDMLEKTETKNSEDRTCRHFTLLRNPLPEDWTAFNKYAHRVRNLLVLGDELCSHELDILCAFGTSNTNPPLLPRLRHLTWKGPNLAFALLFAGPRLRDLGLLAPPDDDSSAAFYTVISRLSPDLERLCIYSEAIQTASLTPFQTLQSTSWSSLRELWSTVSVSPEVLLALGRLPALTDINLEVAHGPDLPPFKVPHDATFFPALTKLVLKGHDLASIPIQPILEAVQSVQLEAVGIYVQELPSASSVKDCFGCLSNCRTLQSVIFFPRTLNLLSPPATHEATLDTLRPLFSLKYLAKLILSVIRYDLDDDGLREIASAWPRLKELSLDTSRDPAPRATLAGLTQFATYCPRLSALNLAVDARNVPIPLIARPATGHTSLALRSLNMTSSPISDPAAVAAYLSGVFPLASVEAVVWWWSPFSERLFGTRNLERWKQVQEFLPVFVAVRQQERRDRTGVVAVLDKEEYLVAHASSGPLYGRTYLF